MFCEIALASAFFLSGGVKLHYVTAGAGEPVVLIHGWASSAQMWQPLMGDLSKGPRQSIAITRC